MEPFVERHHDKLHPDRAGEPGLLMLTPWASLPDLTAGFTSRLGGVSQAPRDSLNTALHVGDADEDVLRNRRLIAKSLGWPFEAWTCAEQVHGRSVHQVGLADRGCGRLDRQSVVADADALMTNERGILLVMYFADCVPLYFYDSSTGAIALAHAGWKGTVANITEAVLEAMGEAYGTVPADVYAAIGPSIGSCCYEVDSVVIEGIRRAIGGADGEGSLYVTGTDGKSRLDLKETNRELMIKAGILPSRIEMTKWCTSCRTDLFYSHRAEQGITGRMMSWLGKE